MELDILYENWGRYQMEEYWSDWVQAVPRIDDNICDIELLNVGIDPPVIILRSKVRQGNILCATQAV